MAAWRRAIELALGDSDVEKLRVIARSRTEPASRVKRARILLGYWENSSFFAVGQALGLHHQTVQRCVERAVAEGPICHKEKRSMIPDILTGLWLPLLAESVLTDNAKANAVHIAYRPMTASAQSILLKP